MSELDPYGDLVAALRAARHPSCQLNLALRLVAVREDRGYYAGIVQQPMTADTRKLLAIELVKEECK